MCCLIFVKPKDKWIREMSEFFVCLFVLYKKDHYLIPSPLYRHLNTFLYTQMVSLHFQHHAHTTHKHLAQLTKAVFSHSFCYNWIFVLIVKKCSDQCDQVRNRRTWRNNQKDSIKNKRLTGIQSILLFMKSKLQMLHHTFTNVTRKTITDFFGGIFWIGRVILKFIQTG